MHQNVKLAIDRRSVTADTALRLAAYFGNSASFWLGLQMDYDLDVAEDALPPQTREEVRQRAVAETREEYAT